MLFSLLFPRREAYSKWFHFFLAPDLIYVFLVLCRRPEEQQKLKYFMSWHCHDFIMFIISFGLTIIDIYTCLCMLVSSFSQELWWSRFTFTIATLRRSLSRNLLSDIFSFSLKSFFVLMDSFSHSSLTTCLAL